MIKTEIEIDTSIFNSIASKEYELSSQEIKHIGPIAACGKYHQRLDNDALEALSKSVEKTACSNGCWYCCYYKVDLRAEEVFRIVDYVRKHFTQIDLVSLRSEINKNAKLMKSLSHEEQLAINIKCTFLRNNSCSIYDVRPEKCRTFHAQDVEGCIQSYEEPTNLEIPNSYVVPVFTSNEAHSEGYKVALQEQGYDAAPYELNTVLSFAMVDGKYRKRYEKRKRAFPQSLNKR